MTWVVLRFSPCDQLRAVRSGWIDAKKSWWTEAVLFLVQSPLNREQRIYAMMCLGDMMGC